jgi:N-carbamoyl-L-amino-acid hydrolase
MMGSGVFAGAFSLEHALSRTDIEGQVGGRRVGPNRLCGKGRARHEDRRYFEAHIEQGPILEETRNTIGIVMGRARPALVRRDR